MTNSFVPGMLVNNKTDLGVVLRSSRCFMGIAAENDDNCPMFIVANIVSDFDRDLFVLCPSGAGWCWSDLIKDCFP